MNRLVRPVGLGLLERISRRSYTELFAFWLMLDFGFALIYLALSVLHPENAPTFPAGASPLERALDALYFSTMTATTVGYGDILPLGASKVLASLEGVLAFATFGLFLAKLVSVRQEAAIQEMHRMAFENTFFTMRHGLFIARKDFDAIIRTVSDGHTLSPRDWHNLTSAFLHVQSWLEDVPAVYQHEIYRIDAKRETLLFDSLYRTITRLNLLLSTLAKKKADWNAQPEALQELQALHYSAQRLPDLWNNAGRRRFATEMRDLLADCTLPGAANPKRKPRKKS